MALRAKEIMEPEVLVLDPGTDVLTCARAMVARRQGCAILGNGAIPIAGIVTEWDIVEKVVAAGRDPANVRVEEIATTPVETCPVDQPTDEVVARMAVRGIRRMPVCDQQRVVGMITSKTVLMCFRAYVDQISADIARYETTGLPTGG